jgi:hypothetical protein
MQYYTSPAGSLFDIRNTVIALKCKVDNQEEIFKHVKFQIESDNESGNESGNGNKNSGSGSCSNITLPLQTTGIIYTNASNMMTVLETHLHSINNQLNNIPSGSRSGSGSDSNMDLQLSASNVMYIDIFENTKDLETPLQSVDNDLLRLSDNIHYDSTTNTVSLGYKQNLTFKSGESYVFGNGFQNMTLFPMHGSILIYNDSYPLETNTSVDINITWSVKISANENFLYISKPGDSTKRLKFAWETI